MTCLPITLSRFTASPELMISNFYPHRRASSIRNDRKGLTLKLEFVGRSLKDFSIELVGPLLEVKAPGLSPPEDADLLRAEFNLGPIDLRYHVGEGFDVEAIRAEWSGAHLTIDLPRVEPEKRIIKIEQNTEPKSL